MIDARVRDRSAAGRDDFLFFGEPLAVVVDDALDLIEPAVRDAPVEQPLTRFFFAGIVGIEKDVGGPTLTRFFAFHVVILPIAAAGFTAVHILLVQKNGMSTPPWIPSSGIRQMRFFPNFFLRELIGWYAALALLGTLAAIFPWELGEKADPFAPAPAGIRPEWYFLAQFYTLKLLPSHVWIVEGEILGLLGFGLVAAAWVLLPAWAVNRAGEARTRLVTGIGVFLLAYFVMMLAYSKWLKHIPIVDADNFHIWMFFQFIQQIFFFRAQAGV